MGEELELRILEMERKKEIKEIVVKEMKEVLGNDERKKNLSDIRRIK